MTADMSNPQPPNAAPPPTPGAMTLGPYVSKAWRLISGDFALFIVGYLLMLLIILVSFITIIGPIILAGPLAFGFMRIVQKRYKGEPAVIGDVFGGFKDFGKALVTVLLFVVVEIIVMIPLAIVGFVLNFIPCLGQIVSSALFLGVALILGAALYFVMPIAALSDVSPVEAFKKGIAFCRANLGSMVLLSFVTGLIAMAGVIACGVGVLLTAPLGIIISVVAYNEYYLPNAQSVS